MTDLPPSLLSEEKIAEIEARHEYAENQAIVATLDDRKPHRRYSESWRAFHGSWSHADRAALLAHVRAQRPGVARELMDAVKPFARVASWGHLTDHNIDGLPVTITVQWPNGKSEDKLTGKDFRLLSEAFEQAHLSPQGVGERGWLPERATAAPAINQLVRLADTAELFLQSTHPDFAKKLRAAVTEAGKLIGVKHYAHTKCCRCGADITGQPYRPTDDFDKRVCLVCQPVGLTLSFPIAHEDRDNYKPKPPAAPPQPPEGTP